MKNRSGLYLFLFIASVAGYVWLGLAYQAGQLSNQGAGICLFKNITGIPCPSCGSTRAILALMKGDIQGSLFWNPIGLILIIIMTVTPVWILFDIAYNKLTLLNFYNNTELFLKRKWIAVPAILLVAGNWLWNIHKGL